MAITYEWKIENIESASSEGDLTDVAKVIHWRFNAVDGDYSATVYGTVGLDEPDSDSFVSFDDLTKETVISWVKNKLELSETEYKNILKQQINEQKTPVTVNKLPSSW